MDEENGVINNVVKIMPVISWLVFRRIKSSLIFLVIKKEGKISFFNFNLIYTFVVFHLPFLNMTQAAIVIAVSATGMAINTPIGPRPALFANRYARGI